MFVLILQIGECFVKSFGADLRQVVISIRGFYLLAHNALEKLLVIGMFKKFGEGMLSVPF